MAQLGEAIVRLDPQSGTLEAVYVRTVNSFSSASVSQIWHPGGPDKVVRIMASNPYRVASMVHNSGSVSLLLAFGFQPRLSGSADSVFSRRLLGENAYQTSVVAGGSGEFTGEVWGLWPSGTLSGSQAIVTQFFS